MWRPLNDADCDLHLAVTWLAHGARLARGPPSFAAFRGRSSEEKHGDWTNFWRKTWPIDEDGQREGECEGNGERTGTTGKEPAR
jgi:hypothetical protein